MPSAGCNGVQVMSVSFDPRQFERSAKLLANEGMRMLEFPMTLERMSKASITLYRLIERHELAHDGDPTFRSHVLAGRSRRTAAVGG